MPSVFCLQANMYTDTNQWLNLHFNPPITSQKDHLRQFSSGFTKTLSINQDLRTRKATYQFTGEHLNLKALGMYLLTTRTEISNNLQTFLEGYFSVQKKQGRWNKVLISRKAMFMKAETLKLSQLNKKFSWSLYCILFPCCHIGTSLCDVSRTLRVYTALILAIGFSSLPPGACLHVEHFVCTTDIEALKRKVTIHLCFTRKTQGIANMSKYRCLQLPLLIYIYFNRWSNHSTYQIKITEHC